MIVCKHYRTHLANLNLNKFAFNWQWITAIILPGTLYAKSWVCSSCHMGQHVHPCYLCLSLKQSYDCIFSNTWILHDHFKLRRCRSKRGKYIITRKSSRRRNAKMAAVAGHAPLWYLYAASLNIKPHRNPFWNNQDTASGSCFDIIAHLSLVDKFHPGVSCVSKHIDTASWHQVIEFHVLLLRHFDVISDEVTWRCCRDVKSRQNRFLNDRDMNFYWYCYFSVFIVKI